MAIQKVLNIEDDYFKHNNIQRALKWNGINNIDHAINAEEGIQKVLESIKSEKAYDLIVVDMHFKVGGEYSSEAGMHVIQRLKSKGIEIPIIVCSSMNLMIPEVVGCIYYHETRDLNLDLKEMLREVKN